MVAKNGKIELLRFVFSIIYLCQLIGLAIVNKFIKSPPMGIRVLLVLFITFVVTIPTQYYGDKLKNYISERIPLLARSES